MIRASIIAAVTLCAGCSVGLDAPPPPLAEVVEDPGPPLSIVAPDAQADTAYTIADDEAPALDGVQITLRVRVNEGGVQRVVLEHLGLEQDDIGGEDLAGNRVALFSITLQ